MQVQKIAIRITKFLGKSILGLLIALILFVALIHLPPAQRQITQTVANYLSSEIEARVEIKRIYFSIAGHVAIEDIAVWDPDNNKIFSANKIEVKSNIIDLITGNFNFDEVSVSGLDGQFIQGEEGLNIQFILDAFQSTEEQPASESNPVNLHFKKVLLENIVFDYRSSISGISVTVNLGKFQGNEAEFSTNPIKIKADQFILEQTIVKTLSTPHQDTLNVSVASKENTPINPDFGSGVILDIRNLELKEDSFFFHSDQITTTPKFDPSHIELSNIQLSLTDIIMNTDTLSAGLKSLAVQLPGFTLTHAATELRWTRNQLVLANLHLASNTTELKADLHGQYDWSSTDGLELVGFDITALSQVNPVEIGYFLDDSLMNYFNHWNSTSLKLEGIYNQKQGTIKTLMLKTGNSQLQAEGMVNDILDLEKMNWKDLEVNATIGSDFKRTLTPFIQDINLPPDASLQVKSAGNLKNILVDGKALTPWGNVKAIGQVTLPAKNVGLDIKLTGENVDLSKWMNISSLGPMDLSLDTKGMIGDNTNLKINGLINEITLLDQSIQHIAFQSGIIKTDATVTVSVEDPDYESEISSEISFEGPLTLTSHVQLDSFRLGRLLHLDSALRISGDLQSLLTIDKDSVDGHVVGKHILFQNQSIKYLLDSMVFHAMISPTATDFQYYSDHEKGNLVSNFGIQDSPKIIKTWSTNILKKPENNIHPTKDRAVHFNIELENASLIKLLGIDVEDFSSLKIIGEFDEQKQTSSLQASSGKFKGYGLSLDTLHTNLKDVRDSITANMNASNLIYNNIKLGNVDFDILTKGDTALSNLRLSSDSITLLGLRTRIFPTDSGAFVYTDKLKAFNYDYILDPKNSVFISNKNVRFNQFLISRDRMQISLAGDVNAFDVSLKHVDLTPLNYLISPDTTVINKGYLTGKVSYSRDQQLNLQADIDSLSLYHSNPLTITATAMNDGNQVPFQFLMTNAANKIDLKGHYVRDNEAVVASLLLDISNLELFDFLVTGVIDEMNGTLKGQAAINGTIQKPSMKGELQFLDVQLTTANPKLTFNVKDDKIILDNSKLLFHDFKIYDEANNPLTVNGNLSTEDYQSFAYDLQLNTENYNLINKPDSASGKIKGTLVIDSDIKLKGNQKDTNVEANLTVKNATKLTFVTSSDEIELLKTDGIIDFIDPMLLLDTLGIEETTYFYDSLISTLPDFNLNSTIKIEDNALIRIVIDEQSGDFIETSGGANLEMGYDRTGNLHLSGNYTIRNGVYRLSFYDLVKKNFTLVQGSSITWNGDPKNGDLNIKAVHTVESNSIGLIGHEIGENEKSVYKRSLDYEVGININGTIEKPIISFSLDLPKEEKVSYPVLANKLDRLRQPEYESELNKQVFGLLVLGGFLPETSGSDINSSLIATTALSNSVNSLLASQLNRFASQYIKGVNIDVGIQSYSDYSSPGGKTQTAMDFRVSKSIMNDRLSFEIGGDFDINQDQSGTNTGTKNYRGDIAIIYDLTGNGDKQLKLFNNETYDIIYQEIRNTGVSLIFIREFDIKEKKKNKD